MNLGSKIALCGNLEFIQIGDLLQVLGSNNATGMLSITSKYADYKGLIYFENGDPVNAQLGQVNGNQAIFSLFGWKYGEFEFLQGPQKLTKNVTKRRMGLILDGARMMDDGKVETIGPIVFKEEDGDSTEKIPVIRGPLVDYMDVVDEEEYLDGHEIVTEGKHGSWIWVILEGQVEVQRKFDNETYRLLRLSTGAFVGSVASFSMSGNIRSATSMAIGNVQLGVLDVQRLNGEYAKLSEDMKSLMLCLDTRLKDITNRSIEIEQRKLTKEDFIRDIEPIIQQGKTENQFFLIKKGTATIARKTKNGYLPMLNLKPGDYFGSFPLFNLSMEPD
ncbi:DUF4388 domain-containing protein, partial [Desulfobacterales bacterium HSG17]|nr:DUF4388 domain-containing protein [Desulfobacterales bacterium HSG17]